MPPGVGYPSKLGRKGPKLRLKRGAEMAPSPEGIARMAEAGTRRAAETPTPAKPDPFVRKRNKDD